MAVFVGGSHNITDIDVKVENVLNDYIINDIPIIISDCYGVDEKVQEYLAIKQYKKVTIYHCANHMRNNIGGWNTKPIMVSEENIRLDNYIEKDDALINDCKEAFFIWDGQSHGTMRNIAKLLIQSKNVIICYNPHTATNSTMYKLSLPNDLSDLLAMIYIENELSNIGASIDDEGVRYREIRRNELKKYDDFRKRVIR